VLAEALQSAVPSAVESSMGTVVGIGESATPDMATRTLKAERRAFDSCAYILMRRVGVRAGMARYDANGIGGGGGGGCGAGAPVGCRDTDTEGSSYPCVVRLPLWKKKEEKSKGFVELMEVDVCRGVKMGAAA
jgi:hypothetical protein